MDLQNSQWIDIGGQELFLNLMVILPDQMENCFTTAIRGFSFSQRIINDWNSLLDDIVSASNILIFKIFSCNRNFDYV